MLAFIVSILFTISECVENAAKTQNTDNASTAELEKTDDTVVIIITVSVIGCIAIAAVIYVCWWNKIYFRVR
jgi:hypothetical protein